MKLSIKQINNLCTGVKLATELETNNINFRKFLTIQGYMYDVNGKISGLKKVINSDILDKIYFELRCYEIAKEYISNNLDVTEDILKNEVYMDNIKGIIALQNMLHNYIEDYSLLKPEWFCDNPL